MSLELLLTRTATIHRRTASGPPDEYNQPTWNEVEITAPCYVDPTGTSTEEGVVPIGTRRVFFGPTTNLLATDLITIDGVTYELVGIPEGEYNARTGAQSHTEVYLTEAQD